MLADDRMSTRQIPDQRDSPGQALLRRCLASPFAPRSRPLDSEGCYIASFPKSSWPAGLSQHHNLEDNVLAGINWKVGEVQDHEQAKGYHRIEKQSESAPLFRAYERWILMPMEGGPPEGPLLAMSGLLRVYPIRLIDGLWLAAEQETKLALPSLFKGRAFREPLMQAKALSAPLAASDAGLRYDQGRAQEIALSLAARCWLWERAGGPCRSSIWPGSQLAELSTLKLIRICRNIKYLHEAAG